jgi:hypothetical protein
VELGLAPPNYALWFDAGTAQRIWAAAEEMGFESAYAANMEFAASLRER